MRISSKKIRTHEYVYCKQAWDSNPIGPDIVTDANEDEQEPVTAVPSVKTIRPGALYDSVGNQGESEGTSAAEVSETSPLLVIPNRGLSSRSPKHDLVSSHPLMQQAQEYTEEQTEIAHESQFIDRLRESILDRPDVPRVIAERVSGSNDTPPVGTI